MWMTLGVPNLMLPMTLLACFSVPSMVHQSKLPKRSARKTSSCSVILVSILDCGTLCQSLITNFTVTFVHYVAPAGEYASPISYDSSKLTASRSVQLRILDISTSITLSIFHKDLQLLRSSSTRSVLAVSAMHPSTTRKHPIGVPH